jgi:hypothetical protein
MIVELDIFSGRPNPRWELGEPARRELYRTEQALNLAEAAANAPPPLGYRGFVYAIDGETRRAYLGQVECGGSLLDDPEHSIERLLLDALPDEFAPVRERITPLLTGGGEPV